MICNTDHFGLQSDFNFCPECGRDLEPGMDSKNNESDCSDVEWDSWVMTSAGMGTDEDYGYYGGDLERGLGFGDDEF